MAETAARPRVAFVTGGGSGIGPQSSHGDDESGARSPPTDSRKVTTGWVTDA